VLATILTIRRNLEIMKTTKFLQLGCITLVSALGLTLSSPGEAKNHGLHLVDWSYWNFVSQEEKTVIISDDKTPEPDDVHYYTINIKNGKMLLPHDMRVFNMDDKPVDATLTMELPDNQSQIQLKIDKQGHPSIVSSPEDIKLADGEYAFVSNRFNALGSTIRSHWAQTGELGNNDNLMITGIKLIDKKTLDSEIVSLKNKVKEKENSDEKLLIELGGSFFGLIAGSILLQSLLVTLAERKEAKEKKLGIKL
jgi:hypothetical protein